MLLFEMLLNSFILVKTLIFKWNFENSKNSLKKSLVFLNLYVKRNRLTGFKGIVNDNHNCYSLQVLKFIQLKYFLLEADITF